MSKSISGSVAVAWLCLVGFGAAGTPAVARPLDSAAPEPPQAEAPAIEQAQVTVDEARALQGAGQWEEAAEAWGQIVKQDPDNGAAWHYLGYCLHAAGHLEEAIKAHKKASTFDDYHGIALYNLGCAHALSGRPDAAFEALAAAQAAGFSFREHALDDSDLESLREDPRFMALLEREPAGMQERIQQALARAHQAVDEQAPQIERQVAGMLQRVTGLAQMMLGRLQQKLAEDERFAVIAQRIQRLLGGGPPTGAPPDAAEGTESSIPPVAMAMIQKAQRHQQAGEWPEAAAVYESLIVYQPDDPGLCFALAYSLHMAGDYEKAIEAHRKAATFDRTRGISLYNLACAYALTGRTDEALEALHASREAGFDLASGLRSDSDLDSLRGDTRFQAFLADVTGDH